MYIVDDLYYLFADYFRQPLVKVNPRSDIQPKTNFMKQSKTFPPFNDAATAK